MKHLKKKILFSPLVIIIIIIVLGVSVAGAIYFGGVLNVNSQNGLVGWWKMDGNAKDREIVESTEFWFPGKAPGKGPAKFDVLLASFETARRLTELVASFEWAACVCDEAHKLKDVNSLTTKAVMEIGYDWLLLLTGTPIQNNVKELFGIMHVLDPEKYPS